MKRTRPAEWCYATAAAAALVLSGAASALAQQDTRPGLGFPVIEARGGAVYLTPNNTTAVQDGQRVLARVVLPSAAAPVLGAYLKEPAHQLLRRLVASGQAAGNGGDLYENRDRSHSLLRAKAHPQLTRVIYDPNLQRRGLDYGLGLTMLFDAPLIGNSSTAQTGNALWRSQPRLALTVDGGPARLYQNYRAGQIHVYPEHRDHDPERGDLLPANTPYMLISQGSSGSDQPHLEALAMILAAFRPDTKAILRETGLIAPTIQMVYRRARVGVRSRAAYLSGAAHPSVFRERDIDLVRMVGLANAILPGEVPPVVQLKILEESQAVPGVDVFGEGLSEVLFDTPSAIARIWRTRLGRRSMVVTAADTEDPNGRGLTFDWVMLRGDRERIRITPLTPDGRYAHIEMDWQDPQPTPGSPDVLSPRIDIGVFANNGVHDSAPAFISVLLPHHETRVYEAEADPVQPVSINRDAPEDYADPLLFPETPWRDVFQYGPGGEFSGWVRFRKSGESRYDAQGRRLDGAGGLRPVDYIVTRTERGRTRIEEVSAD